MSASINAVEGLVGTLLFPVVGVFSLINKTWLPLVVFAFLMLLGAYLKLAYLPMVAVNERAVVKKYWFAFGALAILLIWLIYDGFVK
ncbi:hypothetical protein CK507_02540 [Pseudomonas sp. WN033]|nr:hypothetical protein CK507_02540 [Pseudomonas sp. WN033]